MSLLRRSRCKEALKEAGGIRGIVCEETRRKDLREFSNSQLGAFFVRIARARVGLVVVSVVVGRQLLVK